MKLKSKDEKDEDRKRETIALNKLDIKASQTFVSVICVGYSASFFAKNLRFEGSIQTRASVINKKYNNLLFQWSNGIYST